MKKAIIILVFICLYTNANSQPIDTMFMKCQYKHKSTVQRRRGPMEEIDTMNLEIGKNISKFYSYHNYMVDSIRSNSDPSIWMFYKTTSNQYTLFLNYPKNKTTVYDNAMGTVTYFEYTEAFEIPKWTVHNETQTVLSHPCRKATCRFRGRDYEAWYAIDIPISRGPYKFSGLPGLILKIADTENLYSFECTGIEKVNAPMYKRYSKDVKTVRTTREEFISMNKKGYSNPTAALENMLKAVGAKNIDEIMKKFPDRSEVNYNPIELE
ncbi:MAG: GLPGLI family protein [Prevotellaceae bacterium]|nr:GLPGLI family protein [Prevotellaceae bacterium]